MNSETGEIDTFTYIGFRPHKREICAGLDMETGELVEGFERPAQKEKAKFSVPKNLLKKPESIDDLLVEDDPPPIVSQCCLMEGVGDSDYALTKGEDLFHLKEEIMLGFNKTSHLLYLIPSLIFFFKITAFLLLFVEGILHFYAHKKNAYNTNPHIYYRTPLSIITEQFCVQCRTVREMERVSKIHSKTLKRNKHFHLNLRQVTKSMA